MDGNAPSNKRGAGRPRGRQHDATVRIRMPSPLLEALQTVAPHLHMTVGQIVRSAIEEKLARVVNPLVEIVRDSRATQRQRLQAISMLRLCATGTMWLGPYGKQLARAQALAEATLGQVPGGSNRRSPGTRKSKGTGRKRLTKLTAALQQSQAGSSHFTRPLTEEATSTLTPYVRA